MIFGVAINDLSFKDDSYTVWHSMIRRCYSKVYQEKKPTYKKCSVSKKWLLHSNFNKWFRSEFVIGWQLDKDLLGDSTMYSEETCCFLPAELNSLIVVKDKNDGLPSGVYFKRSHGKYVAQLSDYSLASRGSGHLCISDDVEHCFITYKSAKEAKVKHLAEKYKGQLSQRVYSTLLNFEVSR